MKMRLLTVTVAAVSMLVLGGCSSVTSASGNKPNPAETTMAQNKVASYFLDAYCPVQTV